MGQRSSAVSSRWDAGGGRTSSQASHRPDLIKQVLADGVSRAPVLGDEVYGAASELRWGLRQLGLEYFLNVGGDLLAWTQPAATRLAKKYWGVAEGQPEPTSLATLSKAIRQAQWPSVAWRAADGTRRKTRIAFLSVHVWSDLDRDTGQWPQSWPVVEWPEGAPDPCHLYLAGFKTKPTSQRSLRLSRGRFPIEQFFQRDKTDLGLDRYEGRSWPGFHHHLVLAAVAYLFVTVIYWRSKKTSGATWEQVLHAMQPRLVRLIGCCPCCKTKFGCVSECVGESGAFQQKAGESVTRGDRRRRVLEARSSSPPLACLPLESLVACDGDRWPDAGRLISLHFLAGTR